MVEGAYSFIKPAGYSNERTPYHDVAASALSASFTISSRAPMLASDKAAEKEVLLRLQTWALIINGRPVDAGQLREKYNNEHDNLALFIAAVSEMQTAGLTANEKKRRWYDRTMEGDKAKAEGTPEDGPPPPPVGE